MIIIIEKKRDYKIIQIKLLQTNNIFIIMKDRRINYKIIKIQFLLPAEKKK